MPEHNLNLKTQFAQLRQYIPLMFPFISLTVLVVLLVRVLLPETFSVKDRFAELDKRKDQIFKLEKKLQILNEFEKSNLVDLIEKSQKLIPSNGDLGSLIIYLTSLEKKSGIVIENLNFQATDADTGLQFRLELSGSKEQIFHFFGLIGDPTNQIISIVTISLSTKDKKATQEEAITGIYSIEVVVLAPFAPFPTKVGGVEEAIPELSERERAILEEIALITLETSTSESETSPVDFKPREDPFVF